MNFFASYVFKEAVGLLESELAKHEPELQAKMLAEVSEALTSLTAHVNAKLQGVQ